MFIYAINKRCHEIREQTQIKGPAVAMELLSCYHTPTVDGHEAMHIVVTSTRDTNGTSETFQGHQIVEPNRTKGIVL